MAVEVGVRVIRGPDWSWEDQDGGEGSVGTLVEVKESVPEEEETFPSGTTVKVCWDIAVLSNYRCGFDEKYDLRVFDNAQTGVIHQTVTCDDCKTSPLYGMRWKCATCYDYDLCTECYMSDKHSLEHHFLRYDSPDSESIPVPARSGSRRVQAKGFFKGAVVSRGKDWNWGDQDGGIGKAGILKVLKGWRTESYRSVGEIQWESSDTSNIYRLGHKGKVDLKCDTPGDGGQYYPGHLPVAGAPPSLPPEVDEAVMVVSGDRVRVSVDAESFKRLQEDHGGWNHLMNQLLEKTGVVHSVLDCGDVRVEWDNRVWTVNPASLVQAADGRRFRQKPTVNEVRQTGVLSSDSTTSPIVDSGVQPFTTSNITSSTNPSLTTTSLTSTSSTSTSSTSTSSTFTSSTSTSSTSTISTFISSTCTSSTSTSSTCTGSTFTSSTSTSSTSTNSTSTSSTSTSSTTSTINAPLTTTAVAMTTSPLHDTTSTSGSVSTTEDTIHQELGFHLYQTGDVVRVIDDIALVHQLQDDHGGWNDDIALSLGQLGRVENVFDSGDCKVHVNGYRWTLNPNALIPAPGETPPDVPDGVNGGGEGLGLGEVSSEELNHLSAIGDPRAALVAAFKGDVDTLKDLLSRNPSAVDERLRGETPLQIAASNGKVDVIRLLLQYKANVNIQGHDGSTPLHKACNRQNVAVAEMLLDAGADPRITDGTSFNCLHICTRNGSSRICQLILNKYPELLNVRKVDGFGPLHLASLNGYFPIAKYLLEYERCDIDAITGDGRTALHLAIGNEHSPIAELLIGHGIELDVTDQFGSTALHLAVTHSNHSLSRMKTIDDAPELTKICSTLSDLPSAMVGSAAVACLLVREGADLYRAHDGEIIRTSPLQLCSMELALHLTRFAGERSTFHGSLRKSPKPTSADLVEEEDRHTPQKTVEEPPKPQEEHEPVKTTINDTLADTPILKTTPTDTPIPKTTPTNTPIPKTTPTDTPIPQTVSSVQPDEDEACLLCDKPIDVRIKPCGHTVLCRSHANTAKRCPQCRGPIHCIDDLDPLCGMCQERRCTVTLKPCGHMMCEGCASLMKRCFECKTKVTEKLGLEKISPSSEQPTKPRSDPTPITTTDSREPISDEDHLCEICCTNKKNTAFMCGHQLCYDCSLKVDNCPICRQEIKHRIKLH